jgi:hypothetical protein
MFPVSLTRPDVSLTPGNRRAGRANSAFNVADQPSSACNVLAIPMTPVEIDSIYNLLTCLSFHMAFSVVSRAG